MPQPRDNEIELQPLYPDRSSQSSQYASEHPTKITQQRPHIPEDWPERLIRGEEIPGMAAADRTQFNNSFNKWLSNDDNKKWFEELTSWENKFIKKYPNGGAFIAEIQGEEFEANRRGFNKGNDLSNSMIEFLKIIGQSAASSPQNIIGAARAKKPYLEQIIQEARKREKDAAYTGFAVLGASVSLPIATIVLATSANNSKSLYENDPKAAMAILIAFAFVALIVGMCVAKGAINIRERTIAQKELNLIEEGLGTMMVSTNSSKLASAVSELIDQSFEAIQRPQTGGRIPPDWATKGNDAYQMENPGSGGAEPAVEGEIELQSMRVRY